MQLDELGFSDVSLLEGEGIDSAVDLAGDRRRGGGDNPEVMLLTGQRVILLQGNGKHRRAIFASIQDIDAVEFGHEREGNSAYVWAILAFIVAMTVYFVIDNAGWRIAAPIIVALMGVYLIVDHMMSPGKSLVVFKTGSAELRCDLRSDSASSDIYAFINRLFQLKNENGYERFSRAGRFSPR